MRYPFEHIFSARSLAEWTCAILGLVLILMAFYLAYLLLAFVHQSLHPWFSILLSYPPTELPTLLST